MAWYAARTRGWAAKAVLAAGLLAAVLAAAMPLALLAGLILMLFGHVVAGLALFGASVLTAGLIAVLVLGGVRHVSGPARVLGGRVSQPDDRVGQPDGRVVRLRQDEYHYE